MHAVSVKQPYAEAIASGEKPREFRTWAPRKLVGKDLLIVASRTPGNGYAGEPQGVAICVVLVTKIEETSDGFAWCLGNPRRVGPLPVKGYAALYKIDEASLTFVAGAPSRRAPGASAVPRSSSKPRAPQHSIEEPRGRMPEKSPLPDTPHEPRSLAASVPRAYRAYSRRDT